MDSFAFKVEPFTEDINGRLAWPILGNQLLRAADYSASLHHFGFANVKEKRHVWVLSRLIIEMNERPSSLENYDIATWVNRVYRQFTDRLFKISGKDGKPLGYAHSVWALIDFETRQPISLESSETQTIRDAVEKTNVPIAASQRLELSDLVFEGKCEIRYSDLDINGHVNSISYMRMAIDSVFNAFPLSVHPTKHYVQRVEMKYMRESYFEDRTLHVTIQPALENVYSVAFFRNAPEGAGQECVVKAIVTMKPFEEAQ